MLNQIQYTVKSLPFTNTTILLPFYSKKIDLTKFKDTLETFYYDNDEIKPNNKALEKEFGKRKVVEKTLEK